MQIYVVKNNKLLGILKEKDDLFYFNYEDDIKSTGYLLGLKNKENEADELFPIFENLIPESEIVSSIKHEHGISNTIGILLHLSNNNGSFEFYNKKDFEALTLSENEIVVYESVKNEVLQSKYTYPNILKDYSFVNIEDNKLHPKELNKLAQDSAMGLSGVQYKFAVSLDHKRKEIQFTDNKNDIYFIKPYNKQRCTFKRRGNNDNYIPYLLINEHLFMTMARDFGFDIPYNAIIKEGVDYHYIIKRYDHYAGIKFDHTDFLTFIGKASKHKYDIKFNELKEHVLNLINEEDTLELYKFLVFSVIIGHGDLHAKNLSLIYKSNSLYEKELRLSPFYDIATTKIYGKNVDSRDIGLNIASRVKKFFNRKDLIEVADNMNINKALAGSIIDKYALRFLNDFKTLYVDTLSNEIKALPFHRLKGYGTADTLEVVLLRYVENRKKNIKKYLEVEIKKEGKTTAQMLFE